MRPAAAANMVAMQSAETAMSAIIFLINLGLLAFFVGVLLWRSRKGLAKVGLRGGLGGCRPGTDCRGSSSSSGRVPLHRHAAYWLPSFPRPAEALTALFAFYL